MGSVDILAPDLLKSVADATVATWYKKSGDAVVCDEVLIKIETGRVVLEVPVLVDGIPDTMLEDKGAAVLSRQIPDRLREGNSAGRETSEKANAKASIPVQRQQTPLEEQNNDMSSPVIHRLLAEYNLDAVAIRGTGVDGRLAREDVEKHLAEVPVAAEAKAPAATAAAASTPQLGRRSEERVPMIHLRKRMAERLLEAKSSTAILTTFSEVNMKPIMSLRKQYGDAFEKRHGIRLGFMSFYVKVVVETLKCYPEVNASVDGDDMVYRNYPDISMAVSTPRGLVTPVPRDVDLLGMADTKKNIKELTVKGRDDKLAADDLTSGNSTITSGGAFGSLMSAPIINPPQSAILGMHAIRDCPMAVNDKVEILSTTYLALSHDYRLVDGRESVGSLVVIRELLGDPIRLPLDVQSIRV